jgi:ADP-ribose pyrophosphatase YjhB (NUDIX family)
MQIYAVVYDASGRFLIGQKLVQGYYFHRRQTGRIVPRGQRLNGAGKSALPGGGLEDGETIEAGCRREFFEETGVDLSGRYTQATTKTFDYTNDEHRTIRYATTYFCLDAETLTALCTQITSNLKEGAKAAGEIQQGQITRYYQIHERYPNAPKDNELEDVRIMNVNDPDDWPTIQSWRSDREVDWFSYILEHLKTTIL